MAAEDEDPLADTNMENYGGEEHKQKQKDIADKQKEWDGAGEELGLQVWRINKFRVEHVDQEKYGTFFDGDSYIVLNSYLKGEAKLHNVHFWLGKDTTQDEAGSAAIKTVELDDKLGDLPVQYREVQGHETKAFSSLFPNMNIMGGGHDSGFNHVEPESYQPRLIHVTGKKKKVRAEQVDITIESLNSTDCFILDLGTELIQFRPPGGSMWEKRGCNEKCIQIEGTRSGKVRAKPIVEWDDNPDDNEIAARFWGAFGGKPDSLPEESVYAQQKASEEEAFNDHVNAMWHITDEDGELRTEQVGEGVLDKAILADEKDDVILVDVGRCMFVWIGATANQNEISHAMMNAQNFIYGSGRPAWTPIQRIFDGREPACFWKCFGCEHVSANIM